MITKLKAIKVGLFNAPGLTARPFTVVVGDGVIHSALNGELGWLLVCVTDGCVEVLDSTMSAFTKKILQ